LPSSLTLPHATFMMHPLPTPLLHFIYASVGVSTIAVAFSLAALGLGAFPIVWIVPASFCATLPYHIIILFLSRTVHHGSLRLFSAFNISWGFIVAILWTGATIITVTASVLQSRGTFPNRDMRVGIWILILSAALSLVECVLTWVVAVLNRKERKRIRYAEKWRFNPTNSTSSGLSSQTWRLAVIHFYC